jgi:DNA-binding beta-propeller fold protein YncE
MRLTAAAFFWVAVAACDGDQGMPEIVFGLPDSDYWRDTRVSPVVGEGRILVTNNLSDTVSILDLATVGTPAVAELARVPVGRTPVEREGPHHVAADPSGDFYYVGISNYVPGTGSGPHGVHGAGTADGHVMKIRASDNLTVAQVRVDRNPGDVRLTPDGRTLLVTHFDLLKITEAVQGGLPPEAMDANLAIIDPATMTLRARVKVCPAPHGVAVSPDGTRAYLSCLSDEIAEVSLADEAHPVTRLAVIPDPGGATAPRCSPYALAMSPSGDSVWVSCLASNEVLRYDVAARAMDAAGRVRLPGSPVFGAFTRDGRTLLVPHQAPDGVVFIDAASKTLSATVPLARAVCTNAHVVRLTDDESRAMMVCEGDHQGPGTFVVLEVAGRTVESVVQLGRFPDDIAILRRPR